MALTMTERRSVTREFAKDYARSGRAKKVEILARLAELTGYNRNYLARRLREMGRPARKKRFGRTVVVEDRRRKPLPRGGRPKLYGPAVRQALYQIWKILDCPCGKRLAPYLPIIVPHLERFDEIRLNPEQRERLLAISPATVDRILAHVKQEYRIKQRSHTKPGTLLKHQIPIRTFSEWDENKPGFMEVDLVGHDGGSAAGEFCHTLDMTDVCTGWTETRAVQNRAQVWVFEALEYVVDSLPFPLLGLDSDNGSEFINAHLLAWCRQHRVTFTRARPNRKNDNCFVEQKNYSVVRRTIGYARHDTPEELELLNRIYEHLRLYTNFFQPNVKLIEKTRYGSRIKKRYDAPRTPYHRLLEHLSPGRQAALTRQYNTLNPVAIKRDIDRMLIQLARLVEQKRG
jgi:hypothetical protein